MVATAIIGAGALSAGASIFGSQTAANAQTSAANEADQMQLAMYEQNVARMQPYVNAGNAATNQLTAELPSLTAPISMTEQALQQTPGYQFNLTQGLKSVQNSAAARGLGISGAAMKGASSYATGLADSTYQNQFNNAQTNRTTAYNMLSGQQSVGENAAAGVGNSGTQLGNSLASNTIGAGSANAAAATSAGNAVGSAATNASQAYMLNNLLSGNNSGYFGLIGSGSANNVSNALSGSGSMFPSYTTGG